MYRYKGESMPFLIELVDGLRQNLFAGSGLAFQQNCNVADFRSFVRSPQQRDHCSRTSDKSQFLEQSPKIVV
jgi:hypothetical protein